jgi:hypothetical protein
MKKFLSFFLFFGCFLSSVFGYSATFAADKLVCTDSVSLFLSDSTGLPGALLTHGTPVNFRLQNPLRPEELQEGQIVPVVVEQEVAVVVKGRDKRVVIQREQAGQAVVETVQTRAMFGQAAAVTLRVVQVTTADDTVIPIEGIPFTIRGKGRKGIAWGCSIAVPLAGVALGAPWLLPFGVAGLFIKGKAISKIGLTTRLKGTVRDDVRVYRAR